ncbi:amidohydrolase family protein [Rhodococcus sp. X156]|uniref:amidohydrolase family protein n=1 Tax=Rhodococcus sp. X156 TaxID=2499145 RepID=UPI000FD84EED|nr:amidohydrolase family protein [Rhodococcus sp. X156]
MSELPIIDMHTHVQRDDAHGHEMRDYFLTPHLVKPGAPNLGTLPELLEMMDQVGISAMNMLMFTWSGRYLRHGTYLLPDDAAERDRASAELRARVTRRVSDNNTWASAIAAENPRVGYFAGVNPVVMGAEGAVQEVVAQRERGALGVKLVPSDMGVPGEDPVLFPLYDYCVEQGVPVLTETGGHSPHSAPAGFAGALAAFPQLQLVFAHCGHDRELGHGLDEQVLELAARYDGVHGDTSLRLHEVADGTVAPEEMVAFLRKIGTERVMFGTNYVFSDLLPERPGHRPAPEHVDPRFTQVWKSVDVLQTLPLSDTERLALASGNFTRLTGFAPPR